MQLTLALVQFAIAPSAPRTNLRRMETFIRKAADKGAQLVVFPEDAIAGPLAGQTAFVPQAPAYLAHFQGLAVKYGVDLVPGSWTVSDGTFLYNTAYYINADGTVAGSYRKINLWETEKAAITPGSAVSVFPTAFGRVGLIICWDLSFPPLFTAMDAQGVELVLAPAYWSFTVPSDEVRRVENDEVLLIDSLCTARAFENNIVLAYCNAAGTLKAPGVDAVLSGHSQLTHPLHKVVAQAGGNNEELLLATVELVRKN
jgi:predicted amidohydrolase